MTDWDAPPDGETPEEMSRVLNQRRAEEDHEAFLNDIMWRRLAGYFDRDGRPYTRIPIPSGSKSEG
jgi:hypothetical protein